MFRLVSIGPQWLETFHVLLSQAFVDKLQRLQQGAVIESVRYEHDVPMLYMILTACAG